MFVMTFKYRMYLKCLDKFQELVLPTKMRKKTKLYQYISANTEFSRYRPMFAYLNPSEFCLLGHFKTLVH